MTPYFYSNIFFPSLKAGWSVSSVTVILFMSSFSVAACAPSEKFLTMGGPLAMGFGVVLASSLGTAFLPPTTALGAGVWSIALYGGLILFGGFVLYDTQKVRETQWLHGVVQLKIG